MIRRLWLLLACVLMPLTAAAQVAPIIATTVQTTNTGTTSLTVGCAVGSGSCTGGILSGPISATLISLSSGYVEIQSFVPASQTNRLVNNSGTLQWNGSALAIGGSISGSTNTIPLFTGPSSIGNSIMTQSGTTITVANTLSATTLTGLLSTANQSNVTGVGTITSGTWNATKIGLLYGGTNADLSGTGGTSQFLKQASLGAAITVVRPQSSDLSDASNVALLNAANTFTNTNTFNAVGPFSVGGGGSAANSEIIVNGSNASVSGAYIEFQKNGVQEGRIGHSSAIVEGGTTNNLAIDAASGAGIIFATNAAIIRWGINSAGDFTFGSSSDIADSSGTPALGTGWGTSPTIAGSDYAFKVFNGTTNSTGGAVNFGHTWTNPPICTFNVNSTVANTLSISTVTTTVLTILQSPTESNFTIYVLCRGY